VALNKITIEMDRVYKANNLGYRFLPQHPPFGPYMVSETDTNSFNIDDVPHLVMHRAGTHNFSMDWLPIYNAIFRSRRVKGYPTHYYLDDFLLYMNEWTPPKIMQKCDKIIVLGYLLKPYLEENYGFRNVVQRKTHVDVKLFDATALTPGIMNPDKFNVLWFSMVRTGLGFMKELFAKLNKSALAKDICFWNIMPWAAYVRSQLFENRNVESKYQDYMPYQALIALEKGADLIINPIHMETDNQEFVPNLDRKLFMDSKSEVKYCHAGAASKPLLTCKSLPYETIIKQGENGFISDDVDEWIDIIRDLATSKELYDKVSNEARRDVAENYNIEVRFSELLNDIMGDI